MIAVEVQSGMGGAVGAPWATEEQVDLVGAAWVMEALVAAGEETEVLMVR